MKVKIEQSGDLFRFEVNGVVMRLDKGTMEVLKRKIDEFYESTCFNCKESHICAFAFDDYNTDGDCLMKK